MAAFSYIFKFQTVYFSIPLIVLNLVSCSELAHREKASVKSQPHEELTKKEQKNKESIMDKELVSMPVPLSKPSQVTLVLKERFKNQFAQIKNSSQNLDTDPFVPKSLKPTCTRIYIGDDWNIYVPIPGRKKIPKYIDVCAIKSFPESKRDVLISAKESDPAFWNDFKLKGTESGSGGFIKLNQVTKSGLKFASIGTTMDGGTNRLSYFLDTTPPVIIVDGYLIEISDVQK